jgi:hypothetical protein
MMDDVHATRECDVCRIPHFERNNYYHGQVLGVRDLADEQRYFNEKRWLINRMVIGWGIVCGLDVCLENGDLVVRPGLALDCCGREILVCTPQIVMADAMAKELAAGQDTGYARTPARQPGYSWPAAPDPVQSGEREGPPAAQGPYDQRAPVPPYGTPYPAPEPVQWVLCLDYRECGTGRVPVPAGCEPKAGAPQYTRVRDSYQLRILARKDACPEDQTDLPCAYDGIGRTQLHTLLVAKSLKCTTCDSCECVVLATGTLDAKPYHPPYVRLDDDFWKYRRLVYTNSMLGGIVNCLHEGLARIETINWAPESHFGADEFLDRLSQEHLQVTFDRPVKENTVTNLRSCRLSIFLTDDRSCPVQVLIPVRHIEYANRTATYYFDEDCIESELRNACRRLRKPADIELILHGSMIHNRQGRALDAELIDGFPTGNGVEGGEFIAYFTVGP